MNAATDAFAGKRSSRSSSSGRARLQHQICRRLQHEGVPCAPLAGPFDGRRDETITTLTYPTLAPSPEGWVWRTWAQGITGHGTEGGYVQVTINTYNEVGDTVVSGQQADVPQTFDFSGDASSPNLVQTGDPVYSSTEYDAWGSPIASCLGSEALNQQGGDRTTCLRYSEVDYDAAYAQLPITEAVAVDTSTGGVCDRSVPFCMLETLGTWDRGFGVLTAATDANGQVTMVEYDGLARLSYAMPPAGRFCASSLPPQRFRYTLNADGYPISVIESITEPGCSKPVIESRSYVDGLGRARASIVRTEIDGQWEQSGVATLSKKGQPVLAFQNRFVAATGVPTPRQAVAIGPTTPATETLYDAYGRARQVMAEDSSISRVVYRATSQEAWDPLDLVGYTENGPCTPTTTHSCTPAITRVDGHGRTIDQVQMLRRPDLTILPAEYLRLFTEYRADGVVTRIVRARTSDASPRGQTTIAESEERRFFYDTLGRRIASTDPDTDDPGDASELTRHWRYLYSRAGDLVAVRDPRGCGQDFFYDRAGRLLGEDYIGCAEAQKSGDDPDEEVPVGSLSLEPLAAARLVDVRYYYDVAPPWSAGMGAPPQAYLIGRASGSSDRAQRSIVAYDARGQAWWSARQVAIIPEAADGVPLSYVGAAPPVYKNEVTIPTPREYDTAHTYTTRTDYDNVGRVFAALLPADPDWELFRASGDTSTAPRVWGTMAYNRRGLPQYANVQVGQTTYPVVRSFAYDANRLVTTAMYGTYRNPGVPGANPTLTNTYDVRLRPTESRLALARSVPATPADPGDTLPFVTTAYDYKLDWDAASNLVGITDEGAPGTAFPAGHRLQRRTIQHDSLYRVANVEFEYWHAEGVGGWQYQDAATDWRAERTRVNADETTHGAADPMRREPPAMLPSLPQDRVTQLTYSYDWLANMTEWRDDAESFYERSIGDIVNGNSPAQSGQNLRPSALYLATNVPETAPVDNPATKNVNEGPNPALDRGGWVDVTYGEGGNVEAFTVRAQCHDVSTTVACYLGRDAATGQPTGTLSQQRTNLQSRCACDSSQHYQYRWDELNRLAEARRYDETVTRRARQWDLKVRQRYRYDAGNVRIVKQTLDEDAVAEPPERIHLYVLPGDFERSGVTVDRVAGTYAASLALGTETQYLVAGARVVWKPGPVAGRVDREHRITYAFTDLIQSTSAVFDLLNGELLELTTFYPNGARETHRTTREESYQLELNGFTGKEEDEEVGLVYFGERYLIPRLGRWGSADPLAIHAVGGGEALNPYHYVGGNSLQSRDPDGLDPFGFPLSPGEVFQSIGLAQGFNDVVNRAGQAASDFAEGLSQGDFSDNPSAAAFAGRVVSGEVLGPAADARDFAAAVERGDGVAVAAAGLVVASVPVLGAAVKIARRARRAEGAVDAAGDVARAGRGTSASGQAAGAGAPSAGAAPSTASASGATERALPPAQSHPAGAPGRSQAQAPSSAETPPAGGESITDPRRLLPAQAGPTGHIPGSEIAGRSPTDIARRAGELGLEPRGPNPTAGRGAFVDPATGRRRIEVHPDDPTSGAHGHVYMPDGTQRVDVHGNPAARSAEESHIPIEGQ